MHKLESFLKYCRANTIILTFVSTQYLPVFRIWLNYYGNYQLPNLLVISLDQNVHNLLNDLKVPNILMTLPGFDEFISTKKYDKEESKNLRRLWHLRNDVLQQILVMGFNVLCCDAEAFWLQDIFGFIKRYPHDIISSIAYGHPAELVKKWGFILCLGFFFVRSNRYTKTFWNEYCEFAKGKRSQQKAFCDFLFKNSVAWKGSNIEENEGVLERFSISIKVLNDNVISRNAKKGLYVYHPFLPGDMDEKLAFVKDQLKGIDNAYPPKEWSYRV